MVLEAVMISRMGGFAVEQMIERNKKHEISFFLEDNLTENSEGL